MDKNIKQLMIWMNKIKILLDKMLSLIYMDLYNIHVSYIKKEKN